MSSSIKAQPPHNLKAPFSARSCSSSQRQNIAILALGMHTPISHLANTYSVSRKFIYQQQEKALSAISSAFEEKLSEENILFQLPVTKSWIRQFVLSQVLIAHASYDGVIEVLRDLFDFSISKGNVHNIVYNALEKAEKINKQQNLSQINVGAHDEIYQAGDPVLVGCDTYSTYCYLLSLEDTCDANAWGVHLLDLREKQGLNLEYTIADGGPSARKGQKEAWPDVPCHGDVFHALHPFKKLLEYLNNRASQAIEDEYALRHKIKSPRGKWKNQDQIISLIQKLSEAEKVSAHEITLVDDMTTLFRWLQKDVLGLIGPDYEERKELLSFIVKELAGREHLYRHRIEPVRRYLENHQDNLLGFVPIMERRLSNLAKELKVSVQDIQDVYRLKSLSSSSNKKWEQYEALRCRLGAKYHLLEKTLENLLNSIVRASSLVENLNSRLRNCFTLRKQLGNSYLEILRFFLNHRRFNTSEREERVGKSPTEILTGVNHRHWLELLGFQLFKQAA